MRWVGIGRCRATTTARSTTAHEPWLCSTNSTISPYRAHTLDSIGYSLHHLKRYAEAAHHYKQAIGVYEALGDRYYEAETLHHLGDTEAAAGNAIAAPAAWQKALTISSRLDILR